MRVHVCNKKKILSRVWLRAQNQREHSGLGQSPKHTHTRGAQQYPKKKYFLFKKKRKESKNTLLNAATYKNPSIPPLQWPAPSLPKAGMYRRD